MKINYYLTSLAKLPCAFAFIFLISHLQTGWLTRGFTLCIPLELLGSTNRAVQNGGCFQSAVGYIAKNTGVLRVFPVLIKKQLKW